MNEPIQATAYCIVEHEGKILLTQDNGKRGWKLPGGEVEKGELIPAAAVREVHEETGINIEIGHLALVQEYIKESGQHRLRVYFAATTGNPAATPHAEVEQLAWVPRKQVAGMTAEEFYIPQYWEAIQGYLHPASQSSWQTRRQNIGG